MKQSTTEMQKVFANLQIDYGVNSEIDFFEDNFENHLAGIKQVISRIDSDVREDFEQMCFIENGSPNAFCKNLVLIRFCMGWIDPLFRDLESQALNARSIRNNRKFMLAMYYVYLVYWHLGDDFLVGNVIENVLDLVKGYRLYEGTLAGQTENEVLLMAANSIVKPMLALLDEHYGPKHSPRRYLSDSKEKSPIDPEFDDFMKKLAKG